MELDAKKAYVTHVVDPSNFWARLGTEESLQVISDFVLALSVFGDDVTTRNEAAVSIGQHVIAKSISNGQWRNAVVMSVDPSDLNEGEVDVVYIDYGTTEFVPVSHLITELPEMVKRSQASVLHCRLNGIVPSEIIWTSEAVSRFSNLVVDRTLDVAIASGQEGGNMVIYIDLYVSTDSAAGQNISVADILVSEGFAKVLEYDSEEVASSSDTAANSLSAIPQFDIGRLQDIPLSPSTPPAADIDFEAEVFLSGIDTQYQCEAYTDEDILMRRRKSRDLFGDIGKMVQEAKDSHYRAESSHTDVRKSAWKSPKRADVVTRTSATHKNVNRNLPPRLAKERISSKSVEREARTEDYDHEDSINDYHLAGCKNAACDDTHDRISKKYQPAVKNSCKTTGQGDTRTYHRATYDKKGNREITKHEDGNGRHDTDYGVRDTIFYGSSHRNAEKPCKSVGSTKYTAHQSAYKQLYEKHRKSDRGDSASDTGDRVSQNASCKDDTVSQGATGKDRSASRGDSISRSARDKQSYQSDEHRKSMDDDVVCDEVSFRQCTVDETRISIEKVLDFSSGSSVTCLFSCLERCLNSVDTVVEGNQLVPSTSHLLVCLDRIVYRSIWHKEFFFIGLGVIERFRYHAEFHDSMCEVLKTYLVKCVKTGTTELSEQLCRAYCEFAAHLYIRSSSWPIPGESLCTCIYKVVDKWAIFNRKGENSMSEKLFLYSNCLKSFITVIALHSVKFLEKRFASVIVEVSEKLLSNSMPRSVKMNMMSVMLVIERANCLQGKEAGSTVDAACRTENAVQNCLHSSGVELSRVDYAGYDLSDVASYSEELCTGGNKSDDVDRALSHPHVDGNFLYNSGAVSTEAFALSSPARNSVQLRPPSSYRLTTDSIGNEISKVSCSNVNPKSLPSWVVDTEFPSLEATVGIRHRKHSPIPGAKKGKTSKERKVSTVKSDGQLSPLFAQCVVSACDSNVTEIVNGSVVWKQLPAKNNNFIHPSEPSRRGSLPDDEMVQNVTDISLNKKRLSMSQVLADFLQKDQQSECKGESSTEEKHEVDFVPMFICTLCGEKTHTIRSCPRGIGSMFLDIDND